MKTLKSDLHDRKLRFDGVSEIEPDQLARFLLLGVPPSKLRVTRPSEESDKFNEQVPAEEQLLVVGPEPISLDMGWRLPEEYQKIDLTEHFAALFEAHLNPSHTDEYVEIAIDRIALELAEVKKRGMVEFMRTVIYIIDKLRENKVVWGVGRGSSCASYLLFLIGLHVVDCVTIDVDPQEFYHD
jgi:hypothetical protein